MQTTSTTNSSRKTATSKVVAKTRERAKSIPTSHLKNQQPTPTPATGEQIASMIATAAYFRAEQRGFEPGHELEDWLQAEQHVRRLCS